MKPYLGINLFLILILISCTKQQSGNLSNPPDNLKGYQIVDYPDGSGQKAVLIDGNGKLMEEGPILNGQRNGAWMTFHSNGRIKTLTNFLNGLPQGVHLELTDRGQIEVQAQYMSGILEGPRTKYRFGTIIEEALYKNGQLDGIYKKYHFNGKLEQESTFVDGKREGYARFFNDKGELVMDYEYKNGEIVSGGKVEKEGN